jgi:hypothetical protein
VRLERLGQLKNAMTHDLPACSTVPEPTTLPGAPHFRRCLFLIILFEISVTNIIKLVPTGTYFENVARNESHIIISVIKLSIFTCDQAYRRL